MKIHPAHFFVLSLVVAVACSAPAPDESAASDSPPESAQTSTDLLVGAWTLTSWVNRGSDGSLSYPMGEQAEGQIIYTASGRMSAHLMRPGRTSSGASNAGTSQAIQSGYFGYYGTYGVSEEEGVVTHFVEGSISPGYVGSEQRRRFEFDGPDRIILRPPTSTQGGVERTSELVWERVR